MLGALFCSVALGVPFYFGNYIAEEERASCFTLIVFLAVCVLCLFLTVPRVGLQSVIVVFPSYTNCLTKWSP